VKRNIATICGLAVAVLLVVSWSPAASGAPERPNILLAFADDWGYPHAGVYGDPTIRTPAFDRIAREGVLFEHAFVSSPSCTPSRAALLAGQDFWRLGATANLWPLLPRDLVFYPELLADRAGYFVGLTRKGWGPGRLDDREHNPAGPAFADFAQFLAERPKGTPFCFWFGSQDPHRSVRGDGAALRRAMSVAPEGVVVPPMLPDAAAVREDIAEYYAQVQRFDRDVGELLRLLEERGELDTTLVVISSDHGWSFPRGKTHLYDTGTRVPLAVRWPSAIEHPGRTVQDFVSLIDLAPTFLELAGVPIPETMTGRSILPLLRATSPGRVDPTRDRILTGRERHTTSQEAGNGGGYPMRALRTERYLYIRNYDPDRWPAGTPDHENAYRPGAWLSDTDNGQSKFFLWANRDLPDVRPLYDLAFARRPAEELYDVSNDPHQLKNVAADPEHDGIRRDLAEQLTQALRKRGDPRELGTHSGLDQGVYFGGAPSWPGQDVIDRYRR
jgi:N-sulfoglucosamine sulfohydrolase